MTTIILPKTRIGFKVFNPADFDVNSKSLGLADAMTYFPMKRGAEMISGYWLFMVMQTFVAGLSLHENARIEFPDYDITPDNIAGLPVENMPRLQIDEPLQPQLTDLFEAKATNIENIDYIYALLEASRQEIKQLRLDVLALKQEQEINKTYRHMVDNHSEMLTDILKSMAQVITHIRNWFN